MLAKIESGGKIYFQVACASIENGQWPTIGSMRQPREIESNTSIRVVKDLILVPIFRLRFFSSMTVVSALSTLEFNSHLAQLESWPRPVNSCRGPRSRSASSSMPNGNRGALARLLSAQTDSYYDCYVRPEPETCAVCALQKDHSLGRSVSRGRSSW